MVPPIVQCFFFAFIGVLFSVSASISSYHLVDNVGPEDFYLNRKEMRVSKKLILTILIILAMFSLSYVCFLASILNLDIAFAYTVTIPASLKAIITELILSTFSLYLTHRKEKKYT